MEHLSPSSSSSSYYYYCFVVVSVVIMILCSSSGSVGAYKNYTVGESLGWYDSLENPNVNYQKWADSKKEFTLGDFLLFNTDNNHSVIQTYNLTTYKSCDYGSSLDNDTLQWSSADPSSVSPHPLSIAVPLLKVGPSYFFSGDYDGEQCANGQRFSVNVTRGQGLPPSLRDDDDEAAPAPQNPDAANEDSAPDTVISSNFDHPRDDGGESNGEDDDRKQESGSVNLSSGWRFHGFMIFVGLFCNFHKF